MKTLFLTLLTGILFASIPLASLAQEPTPSPSPEAKATPPSKDAIRKAAFELLAKSPDLLDKPDQLAAQLQVSKRTAQRHIAAFWKIVDAHFADIKAPEPVEMPLPEGFPTPPPDAKRVK